jgi:hypothetical protein
MKVASLAPFSLLAALFLQASPAAAACYYDDPTVSLSISGPGTNGGVEVGVTRITAHVTEGRLRSGSDYSCSNSNYSQAYIYINNRYIGANSVNFNTNEVGDGFNLVRVDVSGNNGGRTSQQRYIEVRNNWIRPEIYNLGDYLELNPDVAGAFGGDPGRTLSHWLFYGTREGRQANRTFAVQEYLESYGDLQAAFGSNYRAAIDHFINNGIREGRAGTLSLRPEVFDAGYYNHLHGDLQAAFGGNTDALKRHWMVYGINEGRRAHWNFWAPGYLNRHGDLINAYGAGNYRDAIKHYIRYGIHEGRAGQ